MAKQPQWKIIQPFVELKIGDVVALYEELHGVAGSNLRKVTGSVEYGRVTKVSALANAPGLQEVRVDFYGHNLENLKKKAKYKPYNLRYYNTSLELIER